MGIVHSTNRKIPSKNDSAGQNPKDIAGSKKSPLHLVPLLGLLQVAEVMRTGAAKYGPYNWRDISIKTTPYIDAILRHTIASADGEDVDPESGIDPLAHVAATALILLDAKLVGKLVDDRHKTKLITNLLGDTFRRKP